MCFVMYDLTAGLSSIHSVVYCDNHMNIPWQYVFLPAVRPVHNAFV
jgi:hypothetical protein